MRIISKSLVLLVFLLLCFNPSFSQKSMRDSAISFPMLGASFQYQVPGGDMADRFGNDINVGGFFQWKLKSNYIFGLDGNFFFSDKIKENNILDGISTQDGAVINEDGHYADILLQERGFQFSLKAGKVFHLFGPNPNSGLLTTLGAGLLQHKIRFETKDNVPELDDNYKKGYDRLTNGLSLTEFVGYIHCGNNRLINFVAGFEFTQAFTQSRRSYDFAMMKQDDKKRLDLLYGLKVGWFFPLYKSAANAFYYN